MFGCRLSAHIILHVFHTAECSKECSPQQIRVLGFWGLGFWGLGFWVLGFWDFRVWGFRV